MPDLSQTPANSVAPQSPSADDFQALKAKVIELERQLAELRDTIDPDSVNQQFSEAITDSHKELCRVLTWQYVSFCRRLLVIEGRLGIPDSYVSCVVPVEIKCHDLVITVPEISVADFARRPMPFGLMPDPTRHFTRGEFPYLTDEELAQLSPRRLEEVSFALPANREVMVPEEPRAVMELVLTPDTQDPVAKQEDVDVEVPDTHDPVITKEEADPEVNSVRDPAIKK